MLHISFGSLPDGVFQRFIVKAHQLSADSVAWQRGIFLMLEEQDRIHCSARQKGETFEVHVKGRAHQERIAHLWKTILKLLDVGTTH